MCNISFNDWVLDNDLRFTNPYPVGGAFEYNSRYSRGGAKEFKQDVRYTVRHLIPENRKSQYIYLRPDLGTEVFKYEDINILASVLGVTLPSTNGTIKGGIPTLSERVKVHMKYFFKWDLSLYKETD